MTPSFAARTVFLARHPETNSRVVDRIQARVHWTGRDTLHLNYSVTGNIDGLRVPPPRSPRQADDLWCHTCFETFISVKGDPAYCEFNFSPSGEWAIYVFSGYRTRIALATHPIAPAIEVRSTGRSFEMDVDVRLDQLALRPLDTRSRLGLCAVIEEADGALSYWALKHPPGKPDFHHPDCFLLEMEPLALEAATPLFGIRR